MPAQKPGVCSDKAALLAAYQQATRAYSESVANLRRIMGTSSRADYDAQFRMTEALRMDAGETLRDLEKHVADHGC